MEISDHADVQEEVTSPYLLLPTAYLPPVSYMAMMRRFPQVVIEWHESYPKQTWRNRCRIMAANGLLDLSIPVKKVFGKHTCTSQVLISGHTSWQRQHWRSIHASYRKSPFFIYFESLFEDHYSQPYSGSLVSWNENMLNLVMKALRMGVSLSATSSYKKNVGKNIDLRDTIHPKHNKFDDLVPIKWPAYQQVFSERHGFIPDLSIIDLLFNLGPDALKYLDRCAELIAQFIDG